MNLLKTIKPLLSLSVIVVCLSLFHHPAFSQQELIDNEEEKQHEQFYDQSSDQVLDNEALVVEQGVFETETSAQVSAQLRNDLEAQFRKIQSLIKTEQAYSERLGEEYLNYGLLLKQVGRLDEARENIVDALHIAKVNNGVYAIEQRPILRALLETNLSLGQISESVENFDKIVWLENKHPAEIGTYSFDLAIKLGHYYLDRFLIETIKTDASVVFLDKAVNYFKFAIRQYGNTPINELLMPYGELSEVLFYRSKINERIKKIQDFSSTRRDRIFDPFDQINDQKFLINTFSQSELYAKLHLKKAEAEQNQQQVVYALLALGDTNLLFGRKKSATSYYKSAWDEAQELSADDPIRLSFQQPVRLPAFNYAIEKDLPERQGSTYAFLPVVANIDESGKVIGVLDSVAGANSTKIASRARRLVKNSKFRPIIENGELLASSGHEEVVRVLVSK